MLYVLDDIREPAAAVERRHGVGDKIHDHRAILEHYLLKSPLTGGHPEPHYEYELLELLRYGTETVLDIGDETLERSLVGD